MAIFPHIEIEQIVQVNDRTRLSGTKSFISKGEAAITSVQIEPFSGSGFVTVSGTGLTSKDWYLDWEYSTDGDKTVSVRITTDGAPVTETKTISVISEANDKLFSKDSDLTIHESDVLQYVPAGKNSFLYVHRRSQYLILDYLDRKGYIDTDGNRLTKASVLDIQEVKEWSTFMTLKLIYQQLKKIPDDFFDAKSKTYESLELEARSRAALRLDLDGDSAIDDGEYLRIDSVRALRR
jgi:hypothetical protein